MRRHLPIVSFVLLLLVNLICAEPARKPLSAENWSKKLRDGDIVFIRSWAVVDRSIDRAITREYRTKRAAIRGFLKQFEKTEQRPNVA